MSYLVLVAILARAFNRFFFFYSVLLCFEILTPNLAVSTAINQLVSYAQIPSWVILKRV